MKEATGMSVVKVDSRQFGIEETKAREIEAAFTPMLAKMSELEAEFNAVDFKASKEITPAVCSEAKALRLKYVKVRTGVAEIHKSQKAYFLAAGRCVDGWKNAHAFASEGIETKLTAIENHFENMEKERIAALETFRRSVLRAAGIPAEEFPSGLGRMAEDVWTRYFDGAKLALEQHREAERKAELDRQAAAKADAAERARLAAENIRLKREAAEREKQEAARRAAEIARRNEEAAKLKREAAEREKQEAARRAAEIARRNEEAAKLKAAQDSLAEASRKVEEERRRQADVEYRERVKSKVKLAVSDFFGVDSAKASEFVDLIEIGMVEGLTLEF